MAGLTTHVLDVTRGRPADGVRVELYELAGGSDRKLIADVVTNPDGRTDKPLISADQARAGRFELVFHAGDYFRRRRAELADPPFLDMIPIRFGVSRPPGALSRAPARLAVELFDLPRKLTGADFLLGGRPAIVGPISPFWIFLALAVRRQNHR